MEIATEKNASYNLEVIVERLDNLKEDNAQEHQAILVQTTKTNGKVADIIRVQERMIGALIAINIIILPVVIGVLTTWINSKL
jgi:hypothetical protein